MSRHALAEAFARGLLGPRENPTAAIGLVAAREPSTAYERTWPRPVIGGDGSASMTTTSERLQSLLAVRGRSKASRSQAWWLGPARQTRWR